MRFKKNFDDECINSEAFRKIYKIKECEKDGKCDRCPWHGGMDNTNPRRPKNDRYKDIRKGKLKNRKYSSIKMFNDTDEEVLDVELL